MATTGAAAGDEEPADWADRHVARWRDHWIDVTFDDEVEAIAVRLDRLTATSGSPPSRLWSRSASRTSNTSPCTC